MMYTRAPHEDRIPYFCVVGTCGFHGNWVVEGRHGSMIPSSGRKIPGDIPGDRVSTSQVRHCGNSVHSSQLLVRPSCFQTVVHGTMSVFPTKLFQMTRRQSSWRTYPEK